MDFNLQQVFGAEAIIRSNHPQRCLILPKEFISQSKETGFIDDLNYWVLFEARKQCKSWQSKSLAQIPVSVNISARQFMFNDIVSIIKDFLSKTKLQAEFLDMEITESGLMER